METALQGVADFFERYTAAWNAVLSGEAPVTDLLAHFGFPCRFIATDGESVVFSDRERLGAFYAQRIRWLRARGGAGLRHGRVTAEALPNALVLADLRWDVRDREGSPALAWRHFYTLRPAAQGYRILISSFHTEE